MDRDAADLDEIWQVLHDRLLKTLLQFGTEGVSRTADFWIDENDWGHLQQKVYLRNLKLLRPEIVAAMQSLLRDFPKWEIIVAVSVPGHDDVWPDMWLTVRVREVIDELRREYLPLDFQRLSFARSAT